MRAASTNSRPLRLLCGSSHLRVRCFLGVSLLLIVAAQTRAQETAQAIIQRSVEANERDWRAAPQFDYSEREEGKGDDKTHDVIMLYGSPYERLVAINGQPLNATQEALEQKKFAREVSERQSETPQKTASRIAKYRTEQNRNHNM